MMDTANGYNVEDIVRRLMELRLDDESLSRFRSKTIANLKKYPNCRASVNEAIWLLRMPVLHHGVPGSPSPVYKGVCEYNGGGSEDDICFETAVKLYENYGN